MDFLQDPTFLQLITELLAEPYSKRNQWGSKNLETICSEIQKASPRSTANTLDSSWERTYNTICLLLAHLDLLGQTDFPEESLLAFLENVPSDKSDSWKCRKTGIELCWNLRKELASFFHPFEKDWNRLSQERSQLDLAQWALVATALKHQELAQLLLKAGKKEREAEKGGVDFSPVWLRDLEADCQQVVALLNQTKKEPSDFWENAA